VRSRWILAAAGAALVSGCLLDWSALRGDFPPKEDGGEDVVVPDVGSDAPAPDGCVPKLLVNELRAAGPNGPSDELVEIYNTSDCAASLEGYSLRYASQNGVPSPNPLWVGAATDRIDAKGYFLLCGESFVPPTGKTCAKWQNLTTPANGALAAGGGGVGLLSPENVLLDGVAYATIATATHPYIRPPVASDGGASTPAPNPPSGQSISRVPNGTDTGVNASDFKIAPSTPGLPN
jgi:hypothetical protein